MSKKKLLIFVLLMLVLFLFIGCAPGGNSVERTQDSGNIIYGFWSGLWHGWVSPITFIISLFSDNVNFYEVHNNGGWYNFGFLLGIGGFSGSTYSSCKRRRRRYY